MNEIEYGAKKKPNKLIVFTILSYESLTKFSIQVCYVAYQTTNVHW